MIDVIAIDERTWNNFIGWFHSDQEHVIERLSRPSESSLVYQVTIEDPKVLTGPWTSDPHIWSLHHEDLEEYYCTNNHEVESYKSHQRQRREQQVIRPSSLLAQRARLSTGESANLCFQGSRSGVSRLPAKISSR